jgi:hypothetical protein
MSTLMQSEVLASLATLEIPITSKDQQSIDIKRVKAQYLKLA